MEKYLIHSNELHFINKERIHREVEKMVEIGRASCRERV